MKAPLTVFALLVLSTSPLFSQSTTIKLPTQDSTSNFIVTDNSNNVLFKIYGTGGFYMLGNSNGASLPALGTGPHLMWDPHHEAFRAGIVYSTQWDSANIGYYSFAAGDNSTASGDGSTAAGENSTASTTCATAMGNSVFAGGYGATAFGTSTRASGNWSTATGYSTTASGILSTALGMNTTASGDSSTALGTWVSTNDKNGACIIGDGSSAGTATNSTANDQMTMRFAGGYRLFTNSGGTLGATLAAGGGSWASISDSTKKEHFAKADGEYFLQSISQLRLGSWNYKGQDAEHYRHYGPMAQEIFHYFGKDQLGTIGNDTTLASADMDGIMMICLQALEKRTSELQKATAKIAELEERTSELQEAREKISALESSLNKLSAVVQTLVDEKKNVSMNVVEKTEH